MACWPRAHAGAPSNRLWTARARAHGLDDVVGARQHRGGIVNPRVLAVLRLMPNSRGSAARPAVTRLDTTPISTSLPTPAANYTGALSHIGQRPVLTS